MWMAFVFGVVVAASIGPIALLIFGMGARHGFAAGTFAGLGAALADFLYALAAFLAGALVLPHLAEHERAIELGGALLLIGLGTWMLASLARAGKSPAAPVAPARAFLPVFLLTVVNPMTFVIFAGIVPQLPLGASPARAAGLAAALAAGSAAVNAGIGGVGALLGRALPVERWRRAMTAAAAAGILGFGIHGAVSAMGGVDRLAG
jgi:threonine/homoserine/homoserine lactone efflux protein